jgi:hypothetical protein
MRATDEARGSIPLAAWFVYCIYNVKEIFMKRTIACLSLALVFTVAAFGQTSQLKSLKDSCCGPCCPEGCGQTCDHTCCPDGCASCCAK